MPGCWPAATTLTGTPGFRHINDTVKVLDHDFPTHAQGTAIPNGIYDVARNTDYVVIGTDHDTAAFAMACSRRW